MQQTLAEAHEVTLGYPERTEILKGVSFSLYERDFVGVIGPNGGGKTTLVKGLLGLIPTQSGRWIFRDEQGRQIPRPAIGYVPQQSKLDKTFPISVQEVVQYGLVNTPLWHTKQWEQRKVREELERVGMYEYRKTPIGKLSGGQLQKVLLARAIVSNPRLLILDEPNTYVDQHFESQLYDLLPEINKNSAIVLVSHDIGSVSRLVRRLFCVNHDLHIHKDIDRLCPECRESTTLEYLSLVSHR